MLFVDVQGDMQVSGTVSSFEHREQCHVLDRIECGSVHQLKIELETSPSLVATQLYPQLVIRKGTCLISSPRSMDTVKAPGQFSLAVFTGDTHV